MHVNRLVWPQFGPVKLPFFVDLIVFRPFKCIFYHVEVILWCRKGEEQENSSFRFFWTLLHSFQHPGGKHLRTQSVSFYMKPPYIFDKKTCTGVRIYLMNIGRKKIIDQPTRFPTMQNSWYYFVNDMHSVQPPSMMILATFNASLKHHCFLRLLTKHRAWWCNYARGMWVRQQTCS